MKKNNKLKEEIFEGYWEYCKKFNVSRSEQLLIADFCEYICMLLEYKENEANDDTEMI